MRAALSLLLVLGWLSTSMAWAVDDIRRDATVAAIEKTTPAVVNIATETIMPTRHPLDELLQEFYDPYYRRQPQRQYSLGSGVIIDEEGYVLTNDHVVRRASRITIKLSDGRECECDRVATSSKSDVALLKIRAKAGEKFAAVKFAHDDDLLLGETVIAMGNPFGLGGSVSRGILSSKNRRPISGNEVLDVADWLQTDAAINPGNSGGPLINLRGELIGINVAVFREGQGIGFAIPIKLVSEALGEIFSPEGLKSLWFGARIKAGAGPLLVTAVQPDSPADQAGIKSGDQVVQLDGKSAGNFIEFNRALVDAGEGREVTLKVMRQGSALSLKVKLVAERSFFNEKLIQKRLGMEVQPLTPAVAERMGLGAAEGLLVSRVDKDSAAGRAGVEQGWLILALDGEPAGDIVAAAKLVQAHKKGDTVEAQVVVPRRRGAFLTIQQGVVKLKVP
jgi:S1-C subfamily serine protease